MGKIKNPSSYQPEEAIAKELAYIHQSGHFLG